MTNNQENRLSMYLTVQQVTNYFSEVWQGYIPFKNQYAEFEKLIEEIQAIRPVQEGVITGVTKDKRDARNILTKKGLDIEAKLYAFASITGNNKLKDRVNYSPSEFRNCRDTVVIDYIRVIYNAASQYITELAEYDLTQENLDELKALNDAFSASVENPRQSVTNRAKATKYLKGYFKEADIVLKERLDKLINYFEESSPDFWNQFISARMIIDLGRGKRVVKEEEVKENIAA